jgi:hypothetical protein
MHAACASRLALVMEKLAQLDSISENGRAADQLRPMKWGAERLAVGVRWLYTHRAELPFIVEVGENLRVSERRLARYIERQVTR